MARCRHIQKHVPDTYLNRHQTPQNDVVAEAGPNQINTLNTFNTLN